MEAVDQTQECVQLPCMALGSAGHQVSELHPLPFPPPTALEARRGFVSYLMNMGWQLTRHGFPFIFGSVVQGGLMLADFQCMYSQLRLLDALLGSGQVLL